MGCDTMGRERGGRIRHIAAPAEFESAHSEAPELNDFRTDQQEMADILPSPAGLLVFIAALQHEQLDRLASLLAITFVHDHGDVWLLLYLVDLRQHRLRDAAELLRDETADAEQAATVTVEGRGVIEWGGEVEDEEEELGGEFVEHGRRRTRGRECCG